MRASKTGLRDATIFTIVCILGFAALGLIRASSEHSLWVDETYTLQVSALASEQLIEVAESDYHPPGYYLLVSSWLRSTSSIDVATPLMRVRLLNLLFWAAAVVAAWLYSRNSDAGVGAWQIGLFVAASAPFATLTQDLRAYGPVSALLVVANTALLASTGAADRSVRVALAAVCAGSMAVAVWFHLLAWPLLFVLLFQAMWLELRRPRAGVPWCSMGLVVAAAAGTPWISRAFHQSAEILTSDTSWMMRPTVANLLKSLLFWPIASRVGDPAQRENLIVTALVLSSLLIVFVLFLQTFRSNRSENQKGPRSESLQLLLGLGASTTFVLCTWLAARLEFAPLYHGTRYQLLVAPTLSFYIAVWLSRTPGRLSLLATGLLLTASVGGQISLLARESLGEPRLANLVERATETANGTPLVVLPTSMTEFHSRAFSTRPATSGPREACANEQGFQLLSLSPWDALASPDERVLVGLLASGRFSQSGLTTAPPGLDYYKLMEVRRGATFSESTCELAFEKPTWSGSATAAWASPAGQRGAGWSFLEVGDSGRPHIWTDRRDVTVLFDRSVKGERARLRLSGFSSAPPTSPARLEVLVGQTTVSVEVAGSFMIDDLIELGGSVGNLKVRHALSKLGNRRLGMSFLGASLDPVGTVGAGTQ